MTSPVGVSGIGCPSMFLRSKENLFTFSKCYQETPNIQRATIDEDKQGQLTANFRRRPIEICPALLGLVTVQVKKPWTLGFDSDRSVVC